MWCFGSFLSHRVFALGKGAWVVHCGWRHTFARQKYSCYTAPDIQLTPLWFSITDCPSERVHKGWSKCFLQFWQYFSCDSASLQSAWIPAIKSASTGVKLPKLLPLVSHVHPHRIWLGCWTNSEPCLCMNEFGGIFLSRDMNKEYPISSMSPKHRAMLSCHTEFAEMKTQNR